jgi:hypothetical protein
LGLAGCWTDIGPNAATHLYRYMLLIILYMVAEHPIDGRIVRNISGLKRVCNVCKNEMK